MKNYEQSSLWQSAFNLQDDGYNEQRQRLSQGYKQFRERVALLLQQIQNELPGLTLHDITHVDALWRVASEIAGPSYPLNPAEAIVLGGAFLLHDAAHCRAAFPGGLEEIRKTTEWRDAAAQRHCDLDQLVADSDDFQNVLFDTLRVLHPQKAHKLAFACWGDESGNALHLFPDDELREAYGHIIGEIAESHWFNPHELEPFAQRPVAAPVCLAPACWTVNLLKIAVLLRTADAAHIDAARAPGLLQAITRPKGISAQHWDFQKRLNQPCCDAARGELTFTGSPFPADKQEAWWLAYDAAVLVDGELSAANHLLRDAGLPSLAAREVAGARSPESFSRHVPCDGWHPVDASLRIGNIQSVIERFGGAKLYGDKPSLALRELLQNARDAVLACRALGGFGEKEGHIEVHLEEQNGEDWLHVTDTGIGMSRFVMTQVLLDFGRSLWRDPGLRREWPGLAASGFDAVGRFGIGFFSVFMLGKQVKVVTRRYEAHQDDAENQWLLEFTDGISARPSLRQPSTDEALKRHGTCVSVRLSDKEKLLQRERRWLDLGIGPCSESEALSLAEITGALAPALEIDLYTQEGAKERVKTASAGDWRNLDSLKLLERLHPKILDSNPKPWLVQHVHSCSKRLLPIIDINGKIQGRCATGNVGRWGSGGGVVTVGGLFGGYVNHLAGIIAGTQCDRLDRSAAIPSPSVTEASLATWADKQAALLREQDELNEDNSAVLLALGADPEELLLISHGNEAWTTRRLSNELAQIDELWMVEDGSLGYDSDTDEVRKVDFEQHLELDPKMYLLTRAVARNAFITESNWPRPFFNDCPSSPAAVIAKVLNDIWPCGEQEEADEQVIGTVFGTPITRSVTICTSKPIAADTEVEAALDLAFSHRADNLSDTLGK